MLSGRRLLLADDSITIQKVVALTFADEGIEVLAVNNGADAIEKLEEFWPDVVLADVYMPKKTGLQVCEYIKRHEKLKHIPVMLLVGSFEPFDEAEARRVGAEDTLTKPFQSIRNLVEKVGVLLGRESAPETPERVSPVGQPESFEDATPVVIPEEVPDATPPLHVAPAPDVAPTLDAAPTLDGAQTLEFPDLEELYVPEEPMDTGELELTTADTRPLSPEISAHLQQPAEQDQAIETVGEEHDMETPLTVDAGRELSEGFGDTLLDLGDFEETPLPSSDDVILDIEYDVPAAEIYHAAPADNWQSAVAVEAPAASPAVTEVEDAWATKADEVVEWDGEIQTSETQWVAPPPVVAGDEWSVVPAPVTQYPDSEAANPTPRVAEVTAAAAPFTGQITLAQLSPEAIDAIARRVVEQLSEKVVQEIAWEVVPQLAELLIKQKLDEQ